MNLKVKNIIYALIAEFVGGINMNNTAGQ